MAYALQFIGPEPLGAGIVQMVLNAGPMVKFVLLLLFFFSLTSWTSKPLIRKSISKSSFSDAGETLFSVVTPVAPFPVLMASNASSIIR